jgi:hypothetical protein
MKGAIALMTACFLWPGSAGAQNVWDVYGQMEARRLESIRALREAIGKLRDARTQSCAMGNDVSCDLAALNEVELVLLNIENKYAIKANQAATSVKRDLYSKVKEAADRARSEIDDLGDVLADIER